MAIEVEKPFVLTVLQKAQGIETVLCKWNVSRLVLVVLGSVLILVPCDFPWE